jgi:arginyl-tRNA synthetase
MLHRYYAHYQIVSAKNLELSQARLMLIHPVKNVMSVCFELMGISAPEKM